MPKFEITMEIECDTMAEAEAITEQIERRVSSTHDIWIRAVDLCYVDRLINSIVEISKRMRVNIEKEFLPMLLDSFSNKREVDNMLSELITQYDISEDELECYYRCTNKYQRIQHIYGVVSDIGTTFREFIETIAEVVGETELQYIVEHLENENDD